MGTNALLRRRRIALATGVVSTLVFATSGGLALGLLSYGFFNGTKVPILLTVVGVSLLATVLSTLILVRANRELVARGELDFEAVRQRTAEARLRSSTRSLYTLPAYAIGMALVVVVLRSNGGSQVMPWGLVVMMAGLLTSTFFLTLRQRKRAAEDVRRGE